MRIIPKKTKVSIEFVKGVGIPEILLGAIGGGLVFSILLSDLPLKFYFALLVVGVFLMLLVPVEHEKGYQTLIYALRYLSQHKVFIRAKAQKELQEQAQADKKKKGSKRLPPSVEDVTPFSGIQNGFIEFNGKYFGAVLEIDPVEFRLLGEEDQNALIDKTFAPVLRTVTQDQTITLIKLDHPMVYDEFIQVEEEKIEQLKQAYMKDLFTTEELEARIAIVQDRIKNITFFNRREIIYSAFYYLLFTHADKTALGTQIMGAVQRLNAGHIHAKRLENSELAVFLKANYSMKFDPREARGLQPEEYMDWIMPQRIEVKSRSVKYDDIITHNFRISAYPKLVENAWGSKMCNMPSTRVVLKMKPLRTHDAISQIDRSLDELREQKEHQGKASQMLELNDHIDSLVTLLKMLQGENEKLLNVNTYVTAYDYELSRQMTLPKEMRNAAVLAHPFKKDIRFELQEVGMRVEDCFMRQFDAYVSGAVTARDAYQKGGQGIPTSSLAAVFPFVHRTISNVGGIYLGRSEGKPVFLDVFLRDKAHVNSNMMIIGKSGSGKSYATKSLLTNLAADNGKIFILDPENEYGVMASNLGGKIIDAGTAEQGRINPFQIIGRLSDEDEDEDDDADGGKNLSRVSYHAHLQFLEEFYRQILPGIDSDSLEFLNNVTIRIYAQKGIDEATNLSKLEPEDFPIFDNLYQLLGEDYDKAKDEYSRKHLRVLLNYIEKFATGGRNSLLWNGTSTISTKENFIVFNFQSLLSNKNEAVCNAQMLLILKWMDSEIVRNREYNLKYRAERKIIVVIDEAHVFIDSKHPVALDFMYQLAKRIRKYYGMQIVITQNVKDFVGSEELARKSAAIINASQYSMIFPLAPDDMNDLCKLYEKSGALNEKEQRDIVGNGRGQAFLITAPAERSSVVISTPEEIEEVFME